MTSTDVRDCTRCGVTRPVADFHPRGRGGYRSECRECRNTTARQYHLTPEQALAKSLRVTVLTVAQFTELNERSEGRCNVCGEQPRSGKRLAVDHDHTTGTFRGLLCVRCNTALGLVDDDPERLRALINYLAAPPLAN